MAQSNPPTLFGQSNRDILGVGSTEDDDMEIIDLTMKWIVAPLLAVVVWLLKRVTSMSTEIKVLETKIEAQSQASKAAHENLQSQMTQILSKLDSLEAFFEERQMTRKYSQRSLNSLKGIHPDLRLI